MTEFNKPTQEDWDALAEKQVAATGRAQRETLEDATVRAAHKVMTEFNDTERESKVKQENVKAQMQAKTQQEFYDELRNSVLEETAQAIEKMRGFGNDTISSFAIFIRGMKK
jgi:F0F1-type ATP synthase membrane subunit b/b'